MTKQASRSSQKKNASAGRTGVQRGPRKMTAAQIRKAAATASASGQTIGHTGQQIRETALLLPKNPTFEQGVALIGTARLNPQIARAMGRSDDVHYGTPIMQGMVETTDAMNRAAQTHANSIGGQDQRSGQLATHIKQPLHPPQPVNQKMQPDESNVSEAAQLLERANEIRNMIRDGQSKLDSLDPRDAIYHDELLILMQRFADYVAVSHQLRRLTRI